MAPLKAPLPTAWNFPFQFAAGIQSSILMSESSDGVSVAVTLQNARGALIACAAPAPPPGVAGVNAPASTARASVIVTLGTVSDVRPSHVAVASSGPPFISAASSSAHKPPARNLMTAPLSAERLAPSVQCPRFSRGGVTPVSWHARAASAGHACLSAGPSQSRRQHIAGQGSADACVGLLEREDERCHKRGRR